MIHHHYNYTSSLSQFLNYHQLDDHHQNEHDHPSSNTTCEDFTQQDGLRCRTDSSSISNKSFTIAAILGLKSDGNRHEEDDEDTDLDPDLNVVNLSVHQGATAAATRALVSGCGRLQLPGGVRQHLHPHHGGGSVASTTSMGHYSVEHNGCTSRQGTGRGLKHLSSAAVLQNKKSSKSKRVRTIFTPEQLERLEAEFERQQYMVGPERLYLAHTLQLTEAQVKVWFQNRRIKWRKHHLELTHQRLAVLKQQQQLLLDDTNPEDIQDTNSSISTET